MARLLTVTAKQVLEARTFTLLWVGAVLVTLALSVTSLGVRFGPGVLAWVPYPGVWAAGLALALVLVGYGELLRRGSQGDWTVPAATAPWPRAWRCVICLGAGVALVMPLIIASASQTPPRLTPAGLAIALAATLVLPLVMLGTYFPKGSVLDRVRLVGSIVGRHPVAVLAALLIVPLSLPLIEASVFVVTRITSTFSFMLFDLFPQRAGVRTLFRIPYFAPGELRMSWVDFREAGDSRILGSYTDSLRHGYTLIGAIPASLALNATNGLFVESIGLGPKSYLAYRMFFTMVIVTGMLSALAVQARWLGLLSTMDSRRSAASPAPNGLVALPNLSPEMS